MKQEILVCSRIAIKQIELDYTTEPGFLMSHCSFSPQPERQTFIFLPSKKNMLSMIAQDALV